MLYLAGPFCDPVTTTELHDARFEGAKRTADVLRAPREQVLDQGPSSRRDCAVMAWLATGAMRSTRVTIRPQPLDGRSFVPARRSRESAGNAIRDNRSSRHRPGLFGVAEALCWV